MHWIYDQQELIRKLKGEENGPLQRLSGFVFGDPDGPLTRERLEKIEPEFFIPSGNMFYTYPVGELSPYGFEARTLLRSLAADGAFVPASAAALSFAEYSAYSGRLNSLCKKYMEGWEAGKRWPNCGVEGDTQAHCLVRVPAMVARLAGTAALRDGVADCVRVHQAAQGATDYAQAFTALLEKVVLGASCSEALKWGAFDLESPLYDDQRKEVANALADIDMDSRKVVMKYGISCSLPGPFTGPLSMVFTAGGDFKTAVRANLLAGGDNCSRAAVVGSLCGAQGGMAALPADWCAKVTDWAALEALAEKVVSDAGYV